MVKVFGWAWLSKIELQNNIYSSGSFANSSDLTSDILINKIVFYIENFSFAFWKKRDISKRCSKNNKQAFKRCFFWQSITILPRYTMLCSIARRIFYFTFHEVFVVFEIIYDSGWFGAKYLRKQSKNIIGWISFLLQCKKWQVINKIQNHIKNILILNLKYISTIKMIWNKTIIPLRLDPQKIILKWKFYH